ncbi:MAG: energy transducer TonB [Ignavibacteria bacterium]|nr:energy transducer TonB [Ignavibacteria bacterium]MBT8382315.1 energy transducer TonB [Ignavibacteria bacterium]MBT8391943.1 energy transducer TonB [Ignavibacteria bacterium]NNJ52194.1 energy transducer TonB [Ignavibacteriaceae bacterium]NNL21763.1 energy transducer TonB [Ignavibacteriaceae bacterium]
MESLKNIRKPEIRYHYKLVFETSIILSLLIIIFAFKFFPDVEKNPIELTPPQELFTVEDIQQTKQETTPPPPPPKPSMIIEAVTEVDIEEIEFSSTEIDLNQELSAPPPPPKKEMQRVVEEEPVYFVAVEEMPYPIGGVQAIHDLIIYPEIAKRAEVEGKVYVLAYVNEIGRVTKTEVIKGIGAGCDEAAEYAVKHTRFSPGKQRGKPVKVKVMVPIVFKLEDGPA